MAESEAFNQPEQDAREQYLIESLKSEVLEAREYAAATLGDAGSAQALEALLQAFEDKESRVRYSVAASLENLGDERAIKPLVFHALSDSDELVRARAAIALEKFGRDRVIEELLRALEDENPLVRLGVVQSLGGTGDKTFLPLLRQVQTTDQGEVNGKRISDSAAEAIKRIEDAQE